MQKRQEGEKQQNRQSQENKKERDDVDTNVFSTDEAEASWHREENIELLKRFCREGYAQAKKHGHFIVGTGEKGDFIGIPGRFLIEEQPAGGATGFILWQPLAGGEELYEDLEKIDEETAKSVFGYWIAAIDSKTLKISEVW